jgi:hypothetical protein
VPLGRRTGLFILALRPVEFTANPIAAYPTSITGRRTVEDGDIIEASAITLIPYPDMAGAANIAEARRKVARAIFAGRGGAMPQDALPLAMLGIDRGTVRWVDTAMVRRETGAESGVQAMFAARPRAIAEAFLLQHRAHLSDVLSDMAGRGVPPIFPAASMFSLLPPAGAMPAAALRPDDFGFTQLYFPAGVDVDIAFVPEDEIPALAEEALALPPIDLDAAATVLDATGVTILVPVDRPRYLRFRATLEGANLAVSANAASPSPGGAFDLISSIIARRKAAEASVRDAEAVAAAEAEALRVKAWQAAFSEAVGVLPRDRSGTPLVWYTRRRSIAQQPRVTGTGVVVSGDDVGLNAVVNANLDRLKLTKRLATINGEATPQATVRLMSLLASPAVAASDVLTVSVISDIEKVIKEELPPIFIPRESVEMLKLPIATGEVKATAPDLLATRAGLNRLAIAKAAGISTAAREDTPLKLAEGEVMDVAQDYADPNLGQGIQRTISALDGKWPTAKEAVWLGESGKALAVDRGMRTVGEEKLGDFVELLRSAVSAQEPKAIDDLLAKMT